MKKLIAGVLVSCILLGSTVAFADEASDETTELNWEDVTAAIEESGEDLLSQGDFKVLDEIDCKMWVPDVMQEVELTDEDREAGFIAYYSTEDEDGIASVVYVDADGMELDEYAETLKADDEVENVDDMIINGIPCVSYDIPGEDITCVSFSTEAGYILEFSFAPYSDEGYQSIIMIMGASIQPAEDAGETEA